MGTARHASRWDTAQPPGHRTLAPHTGCLLGQSASARTRVSWRGGGVAARGLGGGEVVARVYEAGEDDLEGRGGLGAAAPAVVPPDDRAGAGVAHGVADDRGNAGTGTGAGGD